MLDKDHIILLRLAAIIPVVAADIQHPENKTPTEMHYAFSRALRQKSAVTTADLEALVGTIKALDLSSDLDLIEYIHLGYTLRLGRLFGIVSNNEILDALEDFEVHVARAILREEKKFITQDTVQTQTTGTQEQSLKSATAALIVYNTAFRYYETFQRTAPKKVLPNAKRAEDTAAAKKERQEARAKEKADAKKAKAQARKSKGKGKGKERDEDEEIGAVDSDDSEEDSDEDDDEVLQPRTRLDRLAKKRPYQEESDVDQE